MGVLIKFIDTILFFFFLSIALGNFFFNAHVCLPHLVPLFPTFLKDLMNWYLGQTSDYLVMEKPHFYVGALWIELLFQWPLSFPCLYGMAPGKSWFTTTCLIYGVSFTTSMGTLLAEILGAGRASEKMLNVYLSFFGFGVLAALRGLVPYFQQTERSWRKPGDEQEEEGLKSSHISVHC